MLLNKTKTKQFLSVSGFLGAIENMQTAES